MTTFCWGLSFFFWGDTVIFYVLWALDRFVFCILKPHRKAIQRNRSRKWWLVADVVLCPCVCKSSCPGRPEWCKGGHPGLSREDDSKCEKPCLAQIPSLLMWPKRPAPSIPPRPKWLSPPTARSGISYEPSPSCWVASYMFQLLGQCDQCFWTWPLFQGGARILSNCTGSLTRWGKRGKFWNTESERIKEADQEKTKETRYRGRFEKDKQKEEESWRGVRCSERDSDTQEGGSWWVREVQAGGPRV